MLLIDRPCPVIARAMPIFFCAFIGIFLFGMTTLMSSCVGNCLPLAAFSTFHPHWHFLARNSLLAFGHHLGFGLFLVFHSHKLAHRFCSMHRHLTLWIRHSLWHINTPYRLQSSHRERVLYVPSPTTLTL